MLTPLVFAVCEKVILDKAENPTLIVLLNEVHIATPPEGVTLPSDAVAPKEWAVFTMWNVEAEDFGAKLTQHMLIVHEDGTVFQDKTTEINVKPNVKLATTAANIIGMPVGKPGKIITTVWLDGQREAKRYAYPIHIIHDKPAIATLKPFGST